MSRTLCLTALLLALVCGSAAGAEDACPFDRQALSFSGTPAEQARCLLRPVRRWGRLGEPVTRLPAPFDCLVGEAVVLGSATLQSYLDARPIAAGSIGGELADPLSRSRDGDRSASPARYFVIHDASTPNVEERDFPSDIDSPSWLYNDLSIWDRGSRSTAHVFINRVGDSRSPVSLSQAWRATKFELAYGNTDPKGLFLHIELIQPRRSDPDGPAGNDAIAPDPGFTASQYRRLALVYAAASLRAGAWMIPAFHAALDVGRSGAHDDPQSFELARWAEALGDLLRDINALPAECAR